jgi:S1-C subfamily serine protease
MSIWHYTPVAIHLAQNYTQEAISGVLIVNSQKQEHYVLSICDLPSPEKFAYKLTAPCLISESIVNWLKLDLVDTRYFQEEEFENKGKSVYSFLNGFLHQDKFKFKPHSSHRLTILHLKVSQRLRGQGEVKELLDVKNMTPFNFKSSSEVSIPSKICIQCCPFSLTNTALFMNHKLFGSVNYKSNRGGSYFSDIKYLDDIIGSVVNLDGSDGCIGLVAGALSKTNGDGELLVIVSWNTIFGLLKYPDLSFHNSKVSISPLITEDASASNNTKSFDPIKSVVRISVTAIDGNYWGSGVVLSHDLIVTNKHVVQDHNLLWDIVITSPFRPNVQMKLTDVEVLPCPLVGFDLCFLRLKEPSFDLTPAKISESVVSEMKSFKVGESIRSVGYGLFFDDNTKELRPFISEGNINSIVQKKLDQPNSVDETLMIVSAACWNGSSGGGLFNDAGELVGIMTSNGKLSSGEVMPNFTLAIPVNIVTKCLRMLNGGVKPIALQHLVEPLWSLKSLHENVDVNPMLWKL